uniref:Lysosomal-associated transmembrane protein 4B n=1 Tax=Plectus sambesii TaxID=2011161 RepID=A0A914UN76_9BILA
MPSDGANSRYYGPENPSLSCCCFCTKCHVLTGGKIVAFLLTILYILNLCGSVVPLIIYGNPGCIVVSVCALIVIGLLWYGLLKEKENYMIPFIVCIIVFIVVMTLITILITIAVPILIAEDWHQSKHDKSVGFRAVLDTYSDKLKDSDTVLIVLIILVVTANLTLFIDVWIFYIIIRSYRFIKSKNDGQSIMMVSLTHAPTKV